MTNSKEQSTPAQVVKASPEEGGEWEQEFDERFPPLIGLIPIEYYEYLIANGRTGTEFFMENAARETRAKIRCITLKSFIRSLLSRREAQVRKETVEEAISCIGKAYDEVLGTERDDDANGLVAAINALKALTSTNT